MPNVLGAAQTAEFNEKGFTYARGLFAPDEVKLLTRAMEEDPAGLISCLTDETKDFQGDHGQDAGHQIENQTTEKPIKQCHQKPGLGRA